MELFLEGLTIAFTLENLLFMFIGTLVGLIFAAIPGLTFNTAMVLFIPLTFGLSPVAGISLMLGVFAGGMSGGAFPAILLGIPGVPASAATVIDGYKMTEKGEAGKALGMAVFASVFGGVFSLFVLMLVAPQLAKVALKFGPEVIFSLVIFGFSTIVGLSGKSVIKGLLSGIFGLFLCTVGMDPVLGTSRFTFGSVNMLTGIDIMPVMIGLFALPEVVGTLIEARRAGGKIPVQTIQEKVTAPFPSWKEIKRCFGVLMYSSGIGTFLGAIPGMGGPIAAFIAYDQTKHFTKELGTGVVEGVAAPEAANNAVEGGGLIPLMTLGIPASSGMAILMGAFMIHGLAPGPLLFQNEGGLVYSIFISFFIIYMMALVLQFWGIRAFVKLLSLPRVGMMMTILIISIVGSFIIKLNFFDVIVMFLAGLIAFFMNRYGFSVVALILGLVLGGPIEENLRSAVNMAKGDPSVFVTTPLSLFFLILAALVLIVPAVNRLRKSKKGYGAGGR